VFQGSTVNEQWRGPGACVYRTDAVTILSGGFKIAKTAE